jgi:hypothetical protein
VRPDKLAPAARAVYAALAEPGTETDVAERTGLSPKTVGARIGQDLIKSGLVEVVGHTHNERGRKVRVYGRVPPERVEEARAQAKDRLRVKEPRKRPLEVRKRIVRELLKDQDLVQALAADRAADRATARARKAARDELRERERHAAELRRHEKLAAEAQDPRLPYWRALREFSRGADAARILKLMLERDVQLARTRGEPEVGAGHWSDSLRHTSDMLVVAGKLHVALHDAFDIPRVECPACGASPPEEDAADVVDAEVLDELAELVSGDE